MNGMRKVVFFFTAMVLAAFALPAAAQKVYTLNLAPTSLNAGASGVALSATMNNISPDTGNSSVKSFKLFAPTGGGITITAPASGNNVNLGGGYTATIQNNGSSIYVSNIQLPLKPFGPALVLNMTVNVACTAAGGSWTTQGQVWNGAGFTGQTFTQQNPSFLTPTINPGCAFFTFATSPASVNSPSDTITATFKNTSASANLNSAQVTAPTGITISGGTASNGGSVSVSGQVVSVQGGSAVAPGASLVLTLTATTAPSCTGAAAASWSNAHAYSGPSLGGTELILQTSPYPTTSVNASSCTLSFVSPPSGVAQNTPFALTVHVAGGTGSPSVTIAATGTGCPALSGTLTQNAPVGSDTAFSGLSFNGTGSCTVTASATNYNNSQAILTSFKVLAGTLACDGGTGFSVPQTTPPLDPAPGNAFPPTDGQTGWALVRGLDTGGGCGGVLIPYTFSCNDATRTCQFNEDSLGQHPSIEYVILWPKIAVGSDPTADKQPCVAWGVSDPDPGSVAGVCGGDYVPGLGCNTDNVDGGATVMPDIPNLPPFSDFTGSDHPQYQPGQKAKVCIAQHGFTSGTSDANGNAVGYLIYWTKVIDQSDTGIRLP